MNKTYNEYESGLYGEKGNRVFGEKERWSLVSPIIVIVHMYVKYT